MALKKKVFRLKENGWRKKKGKALKKGLNGKIKFDEKFWIDFLMDTAF